MKKNISLYIHIPFCIKKCNYCDFYSISDANKELQKEYFSSLKRELLLYKKYDLLINTIYIGGGTPTLLEPKYITDLINFIEENFKLSENIEITIEANPETINEEKISVYKDCGINRISIGVQTLNDDELKVLGRVHSADKAISSIKLALKYFDNISIDLMIGIPKQTINSFLITVNKLLEFDIKHLSIYSLKIEPHTNFYFNIDSISQYIPNEDEEREIYWLANNTLKQYGFYQYEISNYAKKGFESKHNLVYWELGDYIGIGAAAHSYFLGYRYQNLNDMSSYLNNIKKGEIMLNKEYINKDESMKEYIILGLRKIKGIDINDFNTRYNADFLNIYNEKIKKLQRYNLITLNGSNLRLTEKGIDLANVVWEEFI
ncbi:radical SAM family heme chaperone HemW [Caldicellulosiruptoraceae bacterium PP1]